MSQKKVYIFVSILLSFIFLGWSIAGAQESRDDPTTLDRLIEALENLQSTSTIQVNMGTEKERYTPGEPFELRFQASKACHIILMHVDPVKKIQFILPNAKNPDIMVEGGKVYSTSGHFNTPLKVVPPPGYDVLNLFCSPEKINLFDADFGNEPLYKITPEDEERQQKLLNRLNALQKYEWAGNSVIILTDASLRVVPSMNGSIPSTPFAGPTGKFFPPIDAVGTTGRTDEDQEGR